MDGTRTTRMAVREATFAPFRSCGLTTVFGNPASMDLSFLPLPQGVSGLLARLGQRATARRAVS